MAQTKAGRSIRAKLRIWMVVVAVVPVVLLGAGGYFMVVQSASIFGSGLEGSERVMSQVVGKNLTNAAKELASQIDNYIEERVKDVVTWASDPLVVEAAIRANVISRKERKWPGYPEIAQDQYKGVMDRIEAEMKATRSLNALPQATEYLKDQLERTKAFREVFFTDKDGYNAAVSNLTSDFVQSDEDWWQNAWKNGIDIGGTSENPLHMKKVPGETGTKVVFDQSAGVWSVAISVRIQHPRTKEPLGVMKAVLDVSAIQALATRTASRTLGSDVKVDVRRTGMLIADTSVNHERRYIMTKEGNLRERKWEPAEKVVLEEAGYSTGKAEFHGVKPAIDHVTGYAMTGGKGQIKELPEYAGLGWAVFVGQDKQLAFAALNEMARIKRRLETDRRGVLLGVSIFGALVVAVVAFVSTRLGRQISVPLQELSGAARKISTGDLNVKVPVRSNDEVGQLAATFNDTVARLRSLVQTEAERDEERRKREDLQRNITRFLDVAMEISQGDLSKRGEVTSDVLGNVVDAINLMVEEIGAIVTEVRQAAVRVGGSANEMIVLAEAIASGAKAQTREAMSVSNAMEDMTASVRQVAQNAEGSAMAAREVLDSAQRGEQAARNTLASMQRIRGEVQAMSKKIKGLGDRSLEISEIVNTIEDFASQTNLLAVNAAIEAAGAGEAGLRFSVVADEVRKLAERSAKATKDIGAVIKNVQAEIQEAIVLMEQGTNEVEGGHQVTLRTEESLKDIAKISQNSAELAQDISAATQQQVRAAESVTTTVQSIAGVALQTEQGVLQTRKTVDDLVRLADELATTLSRFKLSTA